MGSIDHTAEVTGTFFILAADGFVVIFDLFVPSSGRHKMCACLFVLGFELDGMVMQYPHPLAEKALMRCTHVLPGVRL